MSSKSTHIDTTTTALPRTIAIGAAAGLVGAIAMAMFAMIAALTYQNSGFFTPLYHIGSVFIEPSTMMTSMQQAIAGESFYFALGPAIVGALIHMMVGVMYGIVFAIIVRVARLHGVVLIISGLVYGAVVFVISAWIGLPLAAAILSSGDQIADMASMVGYGTFFVEHLLFGVVAALGLLPTTRR
ncbi:MAG: hypothetical protein WBB62_04915 [Rhodococcus sp. (in: high G+C Gram-positive bacteria)]